MATTSTAAKAGRRRKHLGLLSAGHQREGDGEDGDEEHNNLTYSHEHTLDEV